MPDFRTQIEGLATADFVDALGRAFPHRNHIIDLVSPDATKVLFGQALTIGFLPVRKDFMDAMKHSLGPAIYRAIADHDSEGRVLVMASNGYSELSLGGSTKLSRLMTTKMAGVLCDGRLRDFEELAEFSVAVYCKGETTRAGGNMIQPYLANVPVKVDDVTVIPGDYIFADKTGAIVIPEKEIGKTIEMAHKIKAMASQMQEQIKQEKAEAILTQGSKEV